MTNTLYYCTAWKGVSTKWLRAIVCTTTAEDALTVFREEMGLGRRRAGIVVREVTEHERQRWMQEPETSPPVFARLDRM